MSVMRGAEPFPQLWRRRKEIRLAGVGPVEIVSLPDLVTIKKTQRDKDWPMVRRLVEADIATSRPTAARVEFWLRECRTPALLIELIRKYPAQARRIPRTRPALSLDEAGMVRALRQEEEHEREADRRYWAPLRAELERWRLQRPRD